MFIKIENSKPYIICIVIKEGKLLFFQLIELSIGISITVASYLCKIH